MIAKSKTIQILLLIALCLNVSGCGKLVALAASKAFAASKTKSNTPSEVTVTEPKSASDRYVDTFGSPFETKPLDYENRVEPFLINRSPPENNEADNKFCHSNGTWCTD